MNATVNSIFSKYATQYIESNFVSDYDKKIIRAITICRTEELGGRVEECDSCGEKITLFNSCRNRHCPQCQFMKKEKRKVVPGGGYVETSGKWKKVSQNYLVPVKVLSKRFRSIFLLALKNLYKTQDLKLDGTQFKNMGDFQRLIDDLFSCEWIVYIKESFKNTDSVIDYLGKYTHRIAISNHRIISCENGVVRFSYRDYQDENKKKELELPAMKFMKRFMNHTVPKRFVRIRYYGILSNSTKKINVEKCREFFKVKTKKAEVKSWFEIYTKVTGTDLTKCKKCKTGNLRIVETLKPVKMRAGPE